MPKTKQFDETAVLHKAREVFNEKGYNGTSMDDLVKATGLSRSSIYDTFGDKHGLFLKSLDQYRCEQQAGLQPLLDKTTSPKKKIRIVFDETIRDILGDKKKKGCLLINVSMELTCVDKEISKIALTNMEEMEQRFLEWVKEGQALGEIAKTFPPKTQARHLYNCLAGLRITGRSRPDAEALRDVVKVALAMLE